MEEFLPESYPLKEETFKIIGICMEIHRILGRGFLEIVYKDCLQIELKNRKITYEREKQFEIEYKGEIIEHKYFADFIVLDNILLEVKAQIGIVDEHYKQVINYLAVSKCTVGLIVNFGEDSLKFKRVVLTK